MLRAHHCAPVSAGLAAGADAAGLVGEVAATGEGEASAEVSACS